MPDTIQDPNAILSSRTLRCGNVETETKVIGQYGDWAFEISSVNTELNF